MNCTARSYYLSLYTTYLDRSVNASILKCAFHYSVYKHNFYQHVKQLSPHDDYFKASEMKIHPMN